MRLLRHGSAALVVLWLLIGIGFAVDRVEDYQRLVAHGAGDIHPRGVVLAISAVGAASFALLAGAGVLVRALRAWSTDSLIRAGVLGAGVTLVLFGGFGLLLATAVGQTSCESFGAGAMGCGETVLSYERTGRMLFVAASVSLVVLGALRAAAAWGRRGPTMAEVVRRAEVLARAGGGASRADVQAAVREGRER